MNKKLLIIGIFIVVVLSTITLSKSPLPWYDEIFYVDVTNNLIESGELKSSIVPLEPSEDVYRYGFFYFQLQKIIGLGELVDPLKFRLINFFSSVFIILIVFFFLRKEHSLIWGLIFAILTISDAIYVSNSHSGRMDLFVLLLAILSNISFYYWMNSIEIKKSIFWILIGSLLVALTILTSPRGVFLLLPVLIIFFLKIKKFGLINFDFILSSFVFISTFLLTFNFFILNYTRGWESYISEFTRPSTNSHFGFSFMRELYEMPAITSSIILSLVVLFQRKGDKVFVFSFLTMLFFLLFVKSVGPYTAMIMPVSYFLLIYSLARLTFSPLIKNILLASLLLINLSIFTFKSFNILSSWKLRSLSHSSYSDLSKVDGFVLAPYKFYYYFKTSGIIFQANEFLECSDIDFYNYIISKKPKYILIDNFSEKKKWYQLLLENDKIKLVGESKTLDFYNKDFFKLVESKLNLRVSQDYNFKLYKVVE